MAITFLEPGGDATQDLSFYGASSGTVAASNDQANTGSYSVKLSTGGSATLAYLRAATCLADAGRRVSFYYRFDRAPDAKTGVLRFLQGANSLVFTISLGTDGTISITPVGATEVTGATVLSANAWNRIAISYTITDTTHFRFDFYVNGTLQGSATAGTMTRVTTSKIELYASAAAGNDFNAWFDDIYIDDGSDYSDPGNILVTAKRPVADGTAVEFTTQIGSGGSGYGSGHSPQVNEQPLSTTNGWSLSTTTKKTEEYNIEAASAGDENLTGKTIVGIACWVYAKESTTSNSPVSNLVNDGTETAITLTTTAALYRAYKAQASYPAGTGKDIGMTGQYTTTAGTYSLYECGILVAYLGTSAYQQTYSATQAATPSVVRKGQRTSSASQAGTPLLAKQPRRPFSATQAYASTVTRSARRILSTTATATASILRPISFLVSVAQAQTVSILRSLSRTVSADQAATPSMTFSRIYLLLFEATQACTATVGRVVKRALLETAAVSNSIRRALAANFLSIQTHTPVLIRGISREFVLGQTYSASMVAGRIYRYLLGATQGYAATLVRKVGKVGAETVSAVASVTRALKVGLSSGQAATGTATRFLSTTLTVTCAATGTAVRSMRRSVSATQEEVLGLTRGIRKRLVSTQAASGTLVRKIARTFLEGVGYYATVILPQFYQLVFEATQACTGSLARAASVTFRVRISVTASLNRAIGRVLSATNAIAAFIFGKRKYRATATVAMNPIPVALVSMNAVPTAILAMNAIARASVSLVAGPVAIVTMNPIPVAEVSLI